MKRTTVILTAGIILAWSCLLWGRNAVNVSGNLKADGYLMINIDWTIDTAKYGKIPQDAMRHAIYDDIWEQAMPQLLAKSGSVASCENTRFTKITENRKLIKTRPDGAKIYDYTAKIKFECTGNTNKMTEQESSQQMQRFNSGFHDGFSDEANAF